MSEVTLSAAVRSSRYALQPMHSLQFTTVVTLAHFRSAAL